MGLPAKQRQQHRGEPLKHNLPLLDMVTCHQGWAGQGHQLN